MKTTKKLKNQTFKLDLNFQIIKNQNSKKFKYILKKDKHNFFQIYSKNLKNKTSLFFEKTKLNQTEIQEKLNQKIFKLNSNFQIIDLNSENFKYVLLKDINNGFQLNSKNLENSINCLFYGTKNGENSKQEYIFKLDSNFQIIDGNSKTFKYVLIQDIYFYYNLYSKNLKKLINELFKEKIKNNGKNSKNKNIFKLNSNFKKLTKKTLNDFQYIFIKYNNKKFQIFSKNFEYSTNILVKQKNKKGTEIKKELKTIGKQHYQKIVKNSENYVIIKL